MSDWVEKYHQKRIGQKGGPGSGHFGHAGRPGMVGGSAPGGGGGSSDVTSTFKRNEFVTGDGQLRPPGEMAETLGLWDRREGYAPSYRYTADNPLKFTVEGMDSEFYAWLSSGKGRNKGTWMNLAKTVGQTILNPATGERRRTGTMTNIMFRAKYPDGEWKEY